MTPIQQPHHSHATTPPRSAARRLARAQEAFDRAHARVARLRLKLERAEGRLARRAEQVAQAQQDILEAATAIEGANTALGADRPESPAPLVASQALPAGGPPQPEGQVHQG